VATVVVLNGASSSGKTTLARAFQEIAPKVFLNFSIDNVLYALPASAIDRITSGADITDLCLPELIRAYYACVRQLLELGHDLVIDHAVTARYHAEHLVSAVASHHVVLVGLDVPPEVLAQRERERGDRREGMAMQQHGRVHVLMHYDLMIDTSVVSPHDGARRILRAVEAGGGAAFERMRESL
jgi:chloramphenicol 3-O phosphotransferase